MAIPYLAARTTGPGMVQVPVPVTVFSWNGTAWVEDTTVRIFIQRTGDPVPTGLTRNDIVLPQQ